VSEIRVLKVRLADLRRQLHVLRSGAANVEALKHEVASLGRALLGERTKVRALSEELETPLNVHRWGRFVWGTSRKRPLVTAQARALACRVPPKLG
jgi:predicted RNase H-like nuclease (RuvC/YqgF family)